MDESAGRPGPRRGALLWFCCFFSLVAYLSPQDEYEAIDLSDNEIEVMENFPLLKRLLKAVRPVPAVFASTGSKMVQTELQKCADGAKGCGCYKTLSSERFFPLHDGLRRASEFDTVDEHLAATQSLIADVAARRWPAVDDEPTHLGVDP